MDVVVQNDIVWVVSIRSGWYFILQPFPEAMKVIKVKVNGKEEKKVVPDPEHRVVKDFLAKQGK